MVRPVGDVVALHGFAGTGRSWTRVAPGAVAPDLPGHGAAAGVPAMLAAAVEIVLAAAPPSFVLAGYSMGGRIALHVALAAPERVQRLVLVSTTAGIEDGAQRAARREADERLAEEIERDGTEAFAGRWTAQPLFAGDPPEARARQREEVLASAPAGLAAALRGLGAGVLPAVWDRLSELAMPAAVLAGARDAKYVALGERVAAALPGCPGLTAVPGAGHGLLREAPDAVARALRP